MGRLPILTKDIVRERWRDLIREDVPLERLSPHFSGGSTGWGTGGSLSTVAGQVRSPFRGDMVLKAIAPGLIAAHVNNVTSNAQVITWTGTENSRWDLNLSANFKDVGGTAQRRSPAPLVSVLRT